MSIILKGIDIPDKENRMYIMELYADGHCSVAKIEDGKCYELTIPSETEAIQIPKGHGRLIDGDKLLKIWKEKHEPNYHENSKAYYQHLQTYWAIAEAETIIEAEE